MFRCGLLSRIWDMAHHGDEIMSEGRSRSNMVVGTSFKGQNEGRTFIPAHGDRWVCPE